jgi:hypothetical protein
MEITDTPDTVGTGMIIDSTCVGRWSAMPSIAGTEWP